MKLLLLQRLFSSDEGTIGSLSYGIKILELPDRNNEKQFSRIPAATYLCKWKKSSKFGYCYQVMDVKDRNNILIHSGNLAGDTKLQYLSHSHGCLLPFLRLGRIEGQLAGLVSQPALRKLYQITNRQDFLLEIRDEQEKE